jgi:hypothetical protein
MKTVRIVSSDGMASSTKITDVESGAEIKGVARAVIEIAAAEPCTAKLEIFGVQSDVRADAEFLIVNPTTGALKAVKRIEFADGESVDF